MTSEQDLDLEDSVFPEDEGDFKNNDGLSSRDEFLRATPAQETPDPPSDSGDQAHREDEDFNDIFGDSQEDDSLFGNLIGSDGFSDDGFNTTDAEDDDIDYDLFEDTDFDEDDSIEESSLDDDRTDDPDEIDPLSTLIADDSPVDEPVESVESGDDLIKDEFDDEHAVDEPIAASSVPPDEKTEPEPDFDEGLDDDSDNLDALFDDDSDDVDDTDGIGFIRGQRIEEDHPYEENLGRTSENNAEDFESYFSQDDDEDVDRDRDRDRDRRDIVPANQVQGSFEAAPDFATFRLVAERESTPDDLSEVIWKQTATNRRLGGVQKLPNGVHMIALDTSEDEEDRDAAKHGDERRLRNILLGVIGLIAAFVGGAAITVMTTPEVQPVPNLYGQSQSVGQGSVIERDSNQANGSGSGSDTGSGSGSGSGSGEGGIIPEGGSRVVYMVRAEGDDLVASTSYVDGSGLQAQETNIDLPWEISIGAKASVIPQIRVESRGFGTLTCSIMVDGEKTDEKTVTGDSPKVGCQSQLN